MPNANNVDIVSALITKHAAGPLSIDADRQIEIMAKRPQDFPLLCQHGLVPPRFNKTTFKPEPIIKSFADMYRKDPSEDLARAIRLWASRGLPLTKVLLTVGEPEVIMDVPTATLLSHIIKDRIEADPKGAKQSLLLLSSRKDAFSIIAIMLGNGEPAKNLNTPPYASRIMQRFASRHGRLNMMKRYGPLDHHLLMQGMGLFALRED
jgi:hypothetical protein